MPREIEKAASRVPLDGGAIFKYPYMSSWKADYTVNGKRLRPTLSPDKLLISALCQRLRRPVRQSIAGIGGARGQGQRDSKIQASDDHRGVRALSASVGGARREDARHGPRQNTADARVHGALRSGTPPRGSRSARVAVGPPGGRLADVDFWDTKADKLAKAILASNQPETCAIPPRLAQYLRALKTLQERRLGRRVGPGDRVFLSPLGCRLNGDNLRNDFYAILVAANIPRIDHRNRSLDLHAGRMTLYSRGAAAGIPMDEMMSFIGHRDIRTALRHYRDPNCLNTQKVAARLAELTDGKNGKGGAQNGNGAVPETQAVLERHLER